jgi:hypothetical protein
LEDCFVEDYSFNLEDHQVDFMWLLAGATRDCFILPVFTWGALGSSAPKVRDAPDIRLAGYPAG